MAPWEAVLLRDHEHRLLWNQTEVGFILALSLRLCDLGHVTFLSVSVSLAENGDNMMNSQDLNISYV